MSIVAIPHEKSRFKVQKTKFSQSKNKYALFKNVNQDHIEKIFFKVTLEKGDSSVIRYFQNIRINNETETAKQTAAY